MEEVIKRLPKVLKAIKKVRKDCLDTKKEGDLTDYGEGQLILSQVILEELGLD